MKTAADALLTTLHERGVELCFANPGTTELEFVRALERLPAMRCVLGLQENVCTGAADGYGRMTGRPAATLLHLGPGFANGIANLHNARRARTPLINLVGDQASWHLAFDAPLTSDIESLARPVSGWVRTLASAGEAAEVAEEAVRRSRDAGGQGVTLVVPADFQAEAVDHGAAPSERTASGASGTSGTSDLLVPSGTSAAYGASDASGAALASSASALGGRGGDVPTPVDASRLEAAAERLRGARHPVFLLGGGGAHSGLGERGQRAAARLVAHLGGRAFAETFPARAERGGGLPDFDRLPYFPEPARAVLDPADVVVLAGALPPITYFGYPGQPSRMVEDARLLVLSAPGEDAAAALEALADRLGTRLGAGLGAAQYAPSGTPDYPPPAEAELTPGHIAKVLARRLPDQAIVSVEGGTCGYPFYASSARAARHTTLTNTGGAIGQGLPVAMGAAIACPGRRVVALLSDGSTQYTVQTLWSLAHERLPVTVLIAANHQYAILRNELRRGGAPLSDAAAAMTSLADPRTDWVALAQGYGVAGLRAKTVGELDAALASALGAPGPMLIEMAL
jgi:acetolactate synthase-1/2/3 large subunit